MPIISTPRRGNTDNDDDNDNDVVQKGDDDVVVELEGDT